VQSSVKHGEEDIAANDLAELLFAATPAATVRNSFRLTTPLQNPSVAHSQVRMSEEAKPLTVGNNLNLKGKVAFLCGASSEKGFGWAIAKELADAGATPIRVAITDTQWHRDCPVQSYRAYYVGEKLKTQSDLNRYMEVLYG